MVHFFGSTDSGLRKPGELAETGGIAGASPVTCKFLNTAMKFFGPRFQRCPTGPPFQFFT